MSEPVRGWQMTHTEAVKQVRDYFKVLGYQILAEPKSQHTSGPDLTIVGKKVALRIEVKTARQTKKNCWQVRGVEKNRLQDDIVAIVFPRGQIHLEEMSQWAKTVAKDGSRGISLLGRLYNRSL